MTSFLALRGSVCVSVVSNSPDLFLLFIYLFLGYIGFRAHPSRQPMSLLAETYGDRSITSGCLFEAVGGRSEGPGFESLLDPYVFIYI